MAQLVSVSSPCKCETSKLVLKLSSNIDMKTFKKNSAKAGVPRKLVAGDKLKIYNVMHTIQEGIIYITATLNLSIFLKTARLNLF